MSLERRAFLKAIGVLGVGSMTGCTQAPVEKLHAYLNPPEDVIPGVAAFYATVCRACPAGCGLWVKTREARPIKLEGNPLHPVNQGALCARGQAFIQSLYSKHRIQQPLMRVQNRLRTASWDEVSIELNRRLQQANSVIYLSGAESGASETVRDEFLSRFSRGQALTYEPLSMASQSMAASLLFGHPQVPWLDLRQTKYILSLGADFLDAWISPVQLARQWADRHSFQSGRPLRMDYIGPRRNLTATAADQWLCVPATQLGPVALYLAYEIWNHKRPQLPANVSSMVEKALNRLGVKPKEVGLAPDLIQAVLQQLIDRPAATVLYGGVESRSAAGTAIHAAALLMNLMTGSLGRSLLLDTGYVYSKFASERKVAEVIETAAGNSLGVLFIRGSNPAGVLPASLEIAAKLDKAATVVSLAYEQSETTAIADFVLPIHHPLESWGDYEVTKGISGLMQPVRTPLYPSRMAEDILIDLAQKMRKPLAHNDFRRYVIARWAPWATGSSSAWEEMLMDGGRFQAPLPPGKPPELMESNLDRLPAIHTETPNQNGCTLLTPMTAMLYDGRSATQDWLKEVPDSVLQTAWDIPVEVSADLAAKYQIEDGDLVSLKSRNGSVSGPALVCADLAPATIALPFGGGGSLVAGDADIPAITRLLSADFDPLSGELALMQDGIELAKVGQGSLIKTQASPYSEDRFLCLAVDLADAQAGRFPRMVRHGEISAEEAAKDTSPAMPMPADDLKERHPQDAVTELPEHPDHRWGMIIDLDRCTGCGACAVACYAENNIPVVGRIEALKRRDLSWLRIEKHIIRNGGQEQVRWLPVMCQHCTNAPCETVCPVFATQHTPDGLNAQIYNRCVGTRYCANNCPYKVRRFNFFDYSRVTPANQQLNPDVTVRPRGVMEKCSFCIQRIREVASHAKAEGRAIREGEIQTACAQTCPTGAITFGDLKQDQWKASKLAADPRAYRLLDYAVNTRPGVIYLRKVNTFSLKPG